MESQNLVIVFTDIAGFTQATAAQSRAENAALLQAHHAMLLPIVEAFGGVHIKNIGDSLLLTFASPTDALLASMAMQDRLYGYNQGRSERAQLHVRIALNMGEVRVTDGDVLGDPVNVAARIESVTPPDEIYFSEAIYMTMNRAEVPAEEVGPTQLKGVTEPITLFRVPRFKRSVLVTDSGAAEGVPTGVAFPFGGAHLRLPIVSKGKGSQGQKVAIGIALIICIVAGLIAWKRLEPKQIETVTKIAPKEEVAIPITPDPEFKTNMDQFKPRHDSFDDRRQQPAPQLAGMGAQALKRAFDDGRISKDQYDLMSKRLRDKREQIRRSIEQAYRNKTTSRDQYQQQLKRLDQQFD